MNTKNTLIISVSIIIGFLVLGLLNRPNLLKSETHKNKNVSNDENIVKLQGQYQVQAAMLEGDYPRSIEVNGKKILYWPEVSYRNSWISTDYRFYTYVDGVLKRIEIENNN